MSNGTRSLQPNAVWHYEGTEMQVKAIKDIGEGDEVFIHYIQLELSRDNRQSKLKSQYFFDCKCERCVREESGVNDINYETMTHLKKQLEVAISDEMEFELRSVMMPMYEKVYGEHHPNMTLLEAKLNMLVR